MLFDDSFAFTDRERRTLRQMREALQRHASGVVPKLAQHKLIQRAPNGAYEWAEPTPETQTEEEITMNKTAIANITTQVLIRGRDVATMSDAEIFKLIARLEQAEVGLCAIRAKSTKLQAAVDALRADVATLVAYVDGR